MYDVEKARQMVHICAILRIFTIVCVMRAHVNEVWSVSTEMRYSASCIRRRTGAKDAARLDFGHTAGFMLLIERCSVRTVAAFIVGETAFTEWPDAIGWIASLSIR